MQKRNDLTKGPEWRCILTFALPIMAGQLLQQLYSTVDGIIVGNFVSSEALAAVGSCSSLVMVFIALSFGMSNGCGIVVAQLFGAQRREDMRRAASTSLILLFGMGVFFTAVFFFTAELTTTAVLGIKDGAIADMVIDYIRFYSLGMIFQFVYNAVASILRSIGDSRAALYFLMVSTLVNTVLDLVFVAVLGWGVAGAAAATSIAQAACCIVSFMYMFRRYEVFRFGRGEWVFDREKLRLCLKMGIPTTIQHMIISCGHLLLQRLVNSFGAVTMAAYTVGSRFDHYASIPSMGMFQAMASFAGQNTGAGRYDRVKRGMFACVAMNLSMVVVICAGLYAFAAPLATLFGVAGEELTQSAECIRFISLCYPLFGFYITFNGMFQGCGIPLAATSVSAIALGGRVVGAYTMAYLLELGYASVWQSCCIGWGLALLLVLYHFFRGKWKTASLVKNQPGEAKNNEA